MSTRRSTQNETTPGFTDHERLAIAKFYQRQEEACLEDLCAIAVIGAEAKERVRQRATSLVDAMRKTRSRFGGIDGFLQSYGLTTKEGIALMCLAEALLRIPDAETANQLIRDKIGKGDWRSHLGQGDDIFVNASTWALMLTGHIVGRDGEKPEAALLDKVLTRLGEPVVRASVGQAMRVLGHQFVMGSTIERALDRARETEARGYSYSYDMLGEGARTQADADRYFDAYRDAIETIGKAAGGRGPKEGPGISVKLSALHPRYEFAQRDRCVPVLIDRLAELARACAHHDIGLTVDAEEADRLEPSLDIFQGVATQGELGDWAGFGLAIQAYQRRALAVVDAVVGLARRCGRPLMVRLVKGAYWDSEIKLAQERGLDSFPVFTRKASTDVSYLSCARRLLEARDALYPQFATHNAHTVAWILEQAGGTAGFEFQRLHGMGEPLYHSIVEEAQELRVGCRVYAPVGGHRDLLPYLVRRLLENGANTSFIHRIRDDGRPVDDVVADPIEKTTSRASKPHPRIKAPSDLFQPERPNSRGIDLSDPLAVDTLVGSLSEDQPMVSVASIIDGQTVAPAAGAITPIANPAHPNQIIGQVKEADTELVDRALSSAVRGFERWNGTSPSDRAAVLDRIADLYEQNRQQLMALSIREAGKTIPDALTEVREAVDFCRYYASVARDEHEPWDLPGPTGETNRLVLEGRGVFACISPWNFPLAIFTGQIVAALVTGNTVISKPAEQTPLIAHFAVQLMLKAGVPPDVLHLLPGRGEIVGQALCRDERVSGIAFTGSMETAQLINRALAARDGPIVPLIAETGGLNAMITDSSALAEQVCDDVVMSGFRSAGQRCSALRVLFVPQQGGDGLIDMLVGAISILRLGDPALLSTDIGPVIDGHAARSLREHCDQMDRSAKCLAKGKLSSGDEEGNFVAPALYELSSLDQLKGEVFGPIVHVLRYPADRIDQVVDQINARRFGLTFGIHSRIDATIKHVSSRIKAGNVYVNRNIIGAIVGSQPFGGQGLSGTGPKAGGPHYLSRFVTERTISTDTTAAGGNASLASLEES